MASRITAWFERVIISWQNASLIDWAPVFLAIVVASWFLARMTSPT